VTHPDVTRYFMTVTEAVELVMQAGAIGRSGEVLVLDMGTPVRIADVARRFAERAAQPVEIVFTGLRPGEKLHEALLTSDEVDERPFHPLISQVPVPPLDPALAPAFDRRLPAAECRAELLALCARPQLLDAAEGAVGSHR
jgi:FlaA1/EpsC-like NDP-sugar epimerase